MARPKKDADLVRPHRITFRLTDVEYEIIKKRCEGAGVESALGAALKIQLDVTGMVNEVHGNLKARYK
ncbi:MAG: hypothetical protein LUG49_07550 [Oscillospiraceae bacterium]|nr:hypothetical protein [Oscillospiraceae bacterium]